MNTKTQYHEYRKPAWAPPSWLFGPVWSLLYVLIALSFGYVFYLVFLHEIPYIVLIPLIANLIFNAAYTPTQFWIRNLLLATADVLLVLITLVWACVWMHPYVPLFVYVNLPYLAWVSFASVLQITITALNRPTK
jgi:benzodiazapine receptor